MTKQKKDCLIGLLVFLGLIALFMLFGSWNEPIETPKRPRKPS